jgi:two-component system sensor histidine kinase RpfC
MIFNLAGGLTTMDANFLKPQFPMSAEQEQAVVRITIGGMALAYVALLFLRDRYGGNPTAFLVAAGYLAFAILVYVATRRRSAASVPHRMMGATVDITIFTYLLSATGDRGAVFVGAYLFIIFGNGFRFGRSYLHTCQVLSIAGFMLVLARVPWWHNNTFAGLGWLIALIVLPFYVSAFAERMREAHLKTGQALKECLQGRGYYPGEK